ncbi:MAG: hypothetical protein K6G09_04910, partial [Treponema sp.]|nr:hypothetical protein [Treponema sp.]
MTRAMKDSGVTWIGEIPEDWNVSQFKYLIVANDGGVWGNDPFNDENDKIVIRSTEQTIDGKWCIENPAKRSFVNENLVEAKIIENDLLMTKSSGSSEHIGK